MTRWCGVVTTAVLAIAVAGAFQPAEAQLSRRASVIVKISVDPSVGGTAIGAATGTAGTTPVSVNKLSWSETHAKQSPLFEGGIGVSASRALEILGLFNYGHAGGNGGVIVGTLGSTPLTANFDDYNFWGADAGVRVRHSSGFGPYVMATVGVRHVSAIDATLVTALGLKTVTGYDASAVPSYSFGGGFLFGDASLALGIEAGLRYAGAPNVSSGAAITPASGAGARWSLPIGIVFRF